MSQQPQLGSILADPLRAAIFGALVALFAKWVDNRMQKKEETLLIYLKFMAFSAGLVAFVVYSVTQKKGRTSSGTGTGTTRGFLGNTGRSVNNIAKQFGFKF